MSPLLMLGASLLPASAAELDPSKLPPPAARQVDFDHDIKPILEGTCLRCHGPERPKSHFRLDTREAALKGGENGLDISPGSSTNSPLIYYVARVVADMEMPPEGKGTPLTPDQVGLFRAWIDQGAVWGTISPQPAYTFSAEPTVRYISVSGDKAKFRELEGVPDGIAGGQQRFSMQSRLGPDTTLSMDLRVLYPDNDYLIKLSLQKTDVGFLHGGFEQWRTYYDDSGGYYRPFPVPAFELNRDLHLDEGRAWFDLGLTLPRWPQIVLGYEYQFRDGTKSTLEWGDVNGKTIYPAAKDIDEHTHIVKLDVTHDVAGWHFEDRARIELYGLRSDTADQKNSFTLPPPQGVILTHEEASHIQGMNTVHLERQVTDGWLISGGYLYSRLSGDASLNQATVNLVGAPSPGLFWSSDMIQLERESHVFSVSTLVTPSKDLNFSVGVQPEWTHQASVGALQLDEGDPNLPQFFMLQPVMVQSDLDTRKVDEEAGVRYTKIPCTVLFAEGRWAQQRTGQTEDLLGDELWLSGHAFFRDTAFTNDRKESRAGFSTSPWSAVSLNAEYRSLHDDSVYDSRKIALESAGYSAFIRARRIDTDTLQTKLSLRPAQWVKLTLTYQLVATKYHTETDPVAGGLSPGGALLAGTYDAHVYGLNLSMTPLPRLYFSGAFTYSDSRTATAQNGDPSLVPYEGDIYTVSANAKYTLNSRTDLQATYAFSRGNFGQGNAAFGLPLGLNYDRHSVMAGISRKLTSSLTTSLKYAFYRYTEPSSGGFNNYTAHGVFGALAMKWP